MVATDFVIQDISKLAVICNSGVNQDYHGGNIFLLKIDFIFAHAFVLIQ
jgi:hypothetical protein